MVCPGPSTVEVTGARVRSTDGIAVPAVVMMPREASRATKLAGWMVVVADGAGLPVTTGPVVLVTDGATVEVAVAGAVADGMTVAGAVLAGSIETTGSGVVVTARTAVGAGSEAGDGVAVGRVVSAVAVTVASVAKATPMAAPKPTRTWRHDPRITDCLRKLPCV